MLHANLLGARRGRQRAAGGLGLNAVALAEDGKSNQDGKKKAATSKNAHGVSFGYYRPWPGGLGKSVAQVSGDRDQGHPAEL
jgi:hypothetical protein